MRLNIRLDLTSEHVRDRLLEGLDQWVRLGLLTESQVRDLAGTMSEPVWTNQSAPQSAQQSAPPLSPLHAGVSSSSDFAPSDFLAEAPGAAQRSAPPNDRKIAKAIRALLEEFSVIWLLFLGVFLVVISSGVLAASQWQSFSSVGQYAILLAYTLLFWGASIWTGGQEKLQSTTKMLSLTTLLLIPINFWMMDALGVMTSAMGLGVGVLAALGLSYIALTQFSARSHQANFIGLSWLHLGWMTGGIAAWPVLATYIGTVSTAVNLTYQDKKVSRERADGAQTKDADQEKQRFASRLLSFEALTIALVVVILLFRSLFIAQVPPHQLGLAAGICGWLLVWLTRSNTQKSEPQLWGLAGSLLLFIGWAVCVTQPQPWQAIAVSFLALSLLWDALKRDWKPAQNLALIAISAQTYWLFGALIPPSTRDTALTRLAAQLSPQPISYYEWLSLGFIPFLIGMLFFVGQLKRWEQNKLAMDTEWLSLGLGACLTLLSVTNSFTITANLVISTVILAVVLRLRDSSMPLVTLTHLVGVSAIAACINYVSPNLSYLEWAWVALAGAITEGVLHLSLHHPRWKLSTGQIGIGLGALCYWLLALNQGTSQSSAEAIWIWLTVPIGLTFVANHKKAIDPKVTAALAFLATLLQTLWLFSGADGWLPVIASFTVGTLCAAANTRIVRTTAAALFTVGSGLMLTATTILWFYANVLPSTHGVQIHLYWPLVIWGLWLWRRRLAQKAGDLSTIYQTAALVWSLLTMGTFLVYGTIVAGAIVDAPDSFVWLSDYVPEYAIASFILLAAALLEAIHHRPAEWRYWGLAWTSEIVVVLALAHQGAGLKEIAIATLAMGLTAQIAGDLWTLKRPPYRASWHGIPIAFALLGVAMGHSIFVADSGLFTIFAGAIAIGVGRRQPTLNPFSYLGLAALSIGAYELLIYRMLQASGGQPGDGFTLLALLGIAIAYAHRLLSPWLLRYLLIPAAALQHIAHAHWVIGTGFAFIATLEGLSQPTGIMLWTGVGILLVAYALATGNQRLTPQVFAADYTFWTSFGIVQALLIALHNRIVWFPDRMFLITWGGIAACVASLILARIRWKALGWPPKPWDILTLWLPLSVLSVAISYTVPTQTLLVVGAFYAWMGKARNQVRLSYISIGLLDWALVRYLDSQGWLTLLAGSIIMGLSLLYFVEIEPSLQGTPNRQPRHWLRIVSSGLISLAALYQAEVYTPTLVYAAITLALCTGLIFAGLGLKVRAFLYVGTTTFMLQVIRVMWLFISENSLLLWAAGIVLGLLFIWVAATFESRRTQVTHRLEAWTSALQDWD
ncbi:MAG: hypothetical protein AB8B99_12365 [Phormidesmis sp.]